MNVLISILDLILVCLHEKASDFSSPVRVAGSNGAERESAAGDEQAEGFICPMCMKGFLDPVELQQHFENEHSGSPPTSLPNASNGTRG